MIHKGGIYRMTFENTFLEAQEFITKFVLNFHLSSQGRLASMIKQSLRGHQLSKTWTGAPFKVVGQFGNLSDKERQINFGWITINLPTYHEISKLQKLTKSWKIWQELHLCSRSYYKSLLLFPEWPYLLFQKQKYLN